MHRFRWLRSASASACHRPRAGSASREWKARASSRDKVALVDQNKVGLGLSVFVSVESNDHSGAWLKKFADAVSVMPEVMEFYRMAGDVDYMLRVVVADMQSYDIFYKKLIGTVPLKNVTSRFAMEKIKSVTALPVPAFEAA
jgi:Lrp/AsnC family transcriptional regulator